MFIRPLKNYGELEIIKTYCYFDRPVLFLCRSQYIEKKFGNYRLFFMLVDEDEAGETFLISIVSEHYVKQLEDCQITIRDFMLKFSWTVDTCKFYYNFNKIDIHHMWDKSKIPEEYLPKPDIYLNN